MPSFFPVVRTSNGRFVYDDVHLTDEGAFEYWRFNHEGLCLKTLRRLVQLWLEALVGAGGMTKDNTERMMKAVASNYQELVVKLPWVFPDELGGDKAFICTAVDGLPLDIELTGARLRWWWVHPTGRGSGRSRCRRSGIRATCCTSRRRLRWQRSGAISPLGRWGQGRILSTRS